MKLSEVNVAEFLGFKESLKELDAKGKELEPNELIEVITKLNTLEYSRVGGVLSVEGMATAKWEYPNFVYERQNRAIHAGWNVIRLSKVKKSTIYVSANNWIDFHFTLTENAIATLVIMP